MLHAHILLVMESHITSPELVEEDYRVMSARIHGFLGVSVKQS